MALPNKSIENCVTGTSGFFIEKFIILPGLSLIICFNLYSVFDEFNFNIIERNEPVLLITCLAKTILCLTLLFVVIIIFKKLKVMGFDDRKIICGKENIMWENIDKIYQYKLLFPMYLFIKYKSNSKNKTVVASLGLKNLNQNRERILNKWKSSNT